jgi:hypothetical protein
MQAPAVRSSGHWEFVVLLLAALGLAPGAAHVLELPVKMGYPPELYARVTGSLYALFGSVGALVQIAAVLAAIALTWRARHRGRAGRMLLSAICLIVSLLLWVATVAPVNAEWARVMGQEPSVIVASYAALRSKWEYGHMAAFIAWFAGFSSLLWTVCVPETDQGSRVDQAHAE